MKKAIFILLIAFAATPEVFSQETRKIILNEFTASINTSDIKDNNSANRTGYGIGIFHAVEISKYVNLLVGLEYNHLSQYKLRDYDGHLASNIDITYNFNTLSFRLFPRVQFGGMTKIFVEAGPQIDIGLYSKWKGTHKYFNTFTSQMDSYSRTGTVFYGVNPYICGGIGLIRTFKKFDLFIKSEYKIGCTKEYDMLEINHRYWNFTVGIHRKG